MIGWDLVESGDRDLDGDVDGTDFLYWQRGKSSNPLGRAMDDIDTYYADGRQRENEHVGGS